MGNEQCWRADADWPMATRAERMKLGDYELVALQVAADGAWPEEFRWEIFGPPNHELQLATGQCDGFERAKADAIKAWKDLAITLQPTIR
jgi:hypothetical protein